MASASGPANTPIIASRTRRSTATSFGEFVTDFRKAGIKPGFYYSTWDRHHPQYENDAAYGEYMRDQVKELLTTYGRSRGVVLRWFVGQGPSDAAMGI